MSVRTSLPNTTIRFGGPDQPSSVTQADMPDSIRSVRRELFERFDATAYRIYSEGMERSELFRFSHRVKHVNADRPDIVYVFQSAVAGAQNRLELDGCQLSQLRTSRRIAAVHRKHDSGAGIDERRAISYRARGGFGNARKVGVTADGLSLSSGDGAVPDVLFASEVSVPHLADQDVEFPLGDRTVRAEVTYGSHCWTKARGEGHACPGPEIIDELGDLRVFCAERYRQSRQLPAMFRKLLSNRVYETGKFDNLGVYVASSTQPTAYTAFFSLRTSRKTPGQDSVRIEVRSAYVKCRPLTVRGIDIARLLGSPRPQLHCNDDAAVQMEGRPDATA